MARDCCRDIGLHSGMLTDRLQMAIKFNQVKSSRYVLIIICSQESGLNVGQSNDPCEIHTNPTCMRTLHIQMHNFLHTYSPIQPQTYECL